MVFGSRSRTSASRFGFAVEKGSRPAWSEIGGILKGRQLLSWRFLAIILSSVSARPRPVADTGTYQFFWQIVRSTRTGIPGRGFAISFSITSAAQASTSGASSRSASRITSSCAVPMIFTPGARSACLRFPPSKPNVIPMDASAFGAVFRT